MRIISFILLFQIALGAIMPFSDYSQWGKLINLVDHYQEHLSEDTDDLSFHEYLLSHFGEINHHHDNSHHNNLPLKHLDAPTFSLFHLTDVFAPLSAVLFTGKTIIIYAETILPEGIDGRIFQPPILG